MYSQFCNRTIANFADSIIRYFNGFDSYFGGDMGIYDRDYTRDNYGGGGHQFRVSVPPVTPVVLYLLIANLAIFFVSVLIPPLKDLFETWFSVYPSNFFFSIQIWRFITYQFLHGGIFHVMFNMLVLYFFGPMFERQWGSKRFLKFYLICGATGGVLYTLIVWLGLMQPGILIGASGAIYGLLAAGAILYPNLQVYVMGIFPLPLKVLAIILAAVSFLNFIGGENAGGEAAHLAGMAMGAVYVLWKPWLTAKMQRSQNARWNNRLAQERTMQAEVDRILDKINSHGIASLTRQEKKTLKQASQRQQHQRK
ncbi:MAG: rhomboid family intramembrane serine protease [Sedimentisphaerales bacterium]|nr:rhomboid family intramembrane serine protease [Sedimentisphaerales bacterium]